MRVAEIMSRHLVALRPEQTAEAALHQMVSLELHAAPVLDPDDGVPIGMIALSDLHGDTRGQTVRDRCSRPALTVGVDASLEHARACMVKTGYHHLVVVDEAGRAVGLLSAIDILRAEAGLPAPTAEVLPFTDPRATLSWSEPRPWEPHAIDLAPSGPGRLVLLANSTIVWAESTRDVRERLRALLARKPDDLVWNLASGPLRYRCAAVKPGVRLLGVDTDAA